MKFASYIGLFSLIILLSFSVGCQNKKGPRQSSGLQTIYFDFDQSSLRPEMVNILDRNASYLKGHKSVNIVVEGHCDERGTNEYNLALGDRRAGVAENYLTQKGISEKRMRTVSYGEERPVDKGHNEAAWYLNRRAEFVRR